jgi:hypothetical protein
VRVLTTGRSPTTARASDGTLFTVGSIPATVGAVSIGAARTWQPMLRETTVIVKNFMMIDSGYREKGRRNES